MSISSIVQIAERLLNGNLGQDQGNQGKSKPAQRATQGQNNQTEFGDRFTRSADTADGNAAGETGILQVENLRFTAVNIQSSGGNTATAATSPAAAATGGNTAVSTGVTPAAAAVPVLAATNPAAATVVPQNTAAGAVVPAIGAAITATPAAPQGATAAAAPNTVQTQQDLQGLNASLSALGLNAAEIAAFDQFASVLLQFDPNALQDLQNQLNLLATQFQTQNAPRTTAPSPNAAATPTPAANSTATATPATAAVAPPPANAPGFQLNELSISFKGVQETVNQGTQNGGTSATTTLSAFSLQIKEVSVTLNNPAGQPTQVQSPQAAVTPTAAAPVAQAAQAATA